MKASRGDIDLMDVHARLERAFGPQGWWPLRGGAEAPRADRLAEIIVGAILTQNTAWTQVEKAIDRLHHADALNWRALRRRTEEELADLIKPVGPHRVKAKRVKNFVRHLWDRYDGDVARLLDGPLEETRRELLSLNGIGPETADAILLYAGGRPTFVVDAYTKRFLRRHGHIDARTGHEDVRRWFQNRTRPDPKLYNDYHALLVELGKRHCRSKARCQGCPLENLPHDAQIP